MTEPKKLAMRDLKEVVSDAAELSKGAAFYADGGLLHLARFETKLFAEAKGSGAAPYKVQILLDATVKGRCSCMAARSRPFCKHAAALLVAWAQTPDAFAVAEQAPAAAGGGDTKKREVKKGKVDGNALMAKGAAQVQSLVAELAVSGLAALGDARGESVRALADGLRENRLRRLSARTLEVAKLLDAAGEGREVDVLAWADLLADLQLSARRIDKHLAGEVLEDRYVEELIGKTWTKKDRTPVANLSLIEVGYRVFVTPDDFRIVESRFIDSGTGEHWSEKQILPSFLARRTEPKRSHAGRVLVGAAGSRYPGFAPFRIDLESEGDPQPVDDKALEKLLAAALPSVGAALAQLQERRRDIFAPELMPAIIRADTLLAEGERLRVVDDKGDALLFPFERVLFERIASSVRTARLCAVIGDVAMEAALPVLHPIGLMIQTERGYALVPIASSTAARKGREPAAARAKKGWVEVARRAGVSTTAIALGETREELARALSNGLAGFTERTALPLAQRLKDLGLEKPGTVLLEASKKPDPRERLDEVIKVHQVTAIALSRLASTAPIDKAQLVSAPTWECVRVRRRDERLAPPAIAASVSRGEMNRFEAAVLYDRYYSALPVEELAARIYPTWADGSASEFVARVFATRPTEAVRAAERALHVPPKASSWLRATARIARITAVRVLQAAGTPEAIFALEQVATHDLDATVNAYARRALPALGRTPPALDAKRLKQREDARGALVAGGTLDVRSAAAAMLAHLGDLDAIPLLRAAMDGDVSGTVRTGAAVALAMLGDVESFDLFLEMLAARNEDNEAGKDGARCLGHLGDIRGVDALLAAYAEGWQPQIVMDAIRQIGPAALDALVAFLEERPELAKRVSTKKVILAMAPEEVTALFCARLDVPADDAAYAARARVLLDMASAVLVVEQTLAGKVLADRPTFIDTKAEGGAELRALARKCKGILEPEAQKPKKKAKATAGDAAP